VDEQLKKDYTIFIGWLANNFKNYIKNGSINIKLLTQAVILEFPLLDQRGIDVVIKKMCTQIEISSMTSGVDVENVNVKIHYREKE